MLRLRHSEHSRQSDFTQSLRSLSPPHSSSTAVRSTLPERHCKPDRTQLYAIFFGFLISTTDPQTLPETRSKPNWSAQHGSAPRAQNFSKWLTHNGFPETKNATAKGGACTFGAAGGDRTHDPWLRRPILYPLSYSRYRRLHCRGFRLVPPL
jgi:hypothetical protein